MDRRRLLRPPRPNAVQGDATRTFNQNEQNASVSTHQHSKTPSPKASDALPLPLYLTNTIFFTLFFAVAYYLLHRWRDKIRNSTPLHVVTLSEIAAIVSLMASFIYLLGFFGIDFVQSFIARSNSDAWDLDDEIDQTLLIDNNRYAVPPCASAVALPSKVAEAKPLNSILLQEEDDEEIVKMIENGSIPSYSLKSKLGDPKIVSLPSENIHPSTLENPNAKSF